MGTLHILFICLLKVCISTATDVETTTGNAHLRVWNIEELRDRDGNFSDGVPPLTFEKLKVDKHQSECFEYHNMCLSEKDKTYHGPVCSYLKKYGLVSFLNDCDINLENCLVKVQDKKIGYVRKKDAFYYNQQGRNCSYYTEQAVTIENAIKLYLLHGSIRRHIKDSL